MKRKLTCFLLSGLFYGTTFAQTLPNPSFDSVYYGGIDRIFEWVTSDGWGIHSVSAGDTVLPLTPNTYYDAIGLQYSEILDFGVYVDTTPFSSAAIRLKPWPNKVKNDGSPYETFVVNGSHFYTDATGYIDFSKCGTPFTGRPLKIKGYYKFSDQSTALDNFGHCTVLLKRYNTQTMQSDTIAFMEEEITFNPSAGWKSFEIPFQYQSALSPDSIVVILKANSNPHDPSIFWVDELTFEYGSIGLEESVLEDLKIYPNPTSDLLNIPGAENLDFRIFTLDGKVVSEGKVGLSGQLNCDALRAGIYVLEIQDGNNKRVFKFMKE